VAPIYQLSPGGRGGCGSSSERRKRGAFGLGVASEGKACVLTIFAGVAPRQDKGKRDKSPSRSLKGQKRGFPLGFAISSLKKKKTAKGPLSSNSFFGSSRKGEKRKNFILLRRK